MKKTDINKAIKEHLKSGAITADIAWPNVDFEGKKPYFHVTIPGGPREGGTLKGGEVLRENGIASIVVVTEIDDDLGENNANDLADAVSDLFPEGHKLTLANGEITIMQPPDIRGGFQDGVDWKVPVIIKYEAERS